jgi:replicative DNA helicase
MEREQKQHLIPKAFRKELKISKRRLNEHVIYIPARIHDNEDKYVMPILQEVRRARKEEGIKTTVEDVLRMRDAGWFRT